ncbi:MAG TPA: exonuclease SbcCD subunit D [Ruminiclostridium sp.]|nr:exonuclease SbcCD subunit D [Ruminiclostridium sp.]
MKILHTSDWHLGKTVMGCQMLPEQEHFIDNVFLPAVDAERPDAIIIAGDIFDRQVPPVEAVRLFSRAISEICAVRGIKTAVISGNHDGAERLAVYSDLLKSQGLFISAKPFDTEPVLIKGGETNVYIHLLPYFDTAVARDILRRDDIRGQNAAFKAVLEKMKPIEGAMNILVSHCFAAGGKTCESESPLSVGGSDEVDPSLFGGFDYVALGHLHGPQRTGANGAYSGSPLKYSFDEEKQKKSIAVLELGGDAVERRLIPIQPLHDMRTITGSIKELIDASENDSKSDDFIYANLTDTRPVFEPMALLREHYPNILGLHPGWLNMTAAEGCRDNLKQGIRTGAGDRLLFEEFLRQVCGAEPQEDELALFDELMEKAGEEE